MILINAISSLINEPVSYFYSPGSLKPVTFVRVFKLYCFNQTLNACDLKLPAFSLNYLGFWNFSCSLEGERLWISR